MASVSALLKSAQSRRTSLQKSEEARMEKIRSYEDSLIAYEWSLSAQTYDDYLEYEKFLRSRQKTTDDPSRALSIEKTITAARKSYVSNEIQRQGMAVLQGRQTNTEKYQAMVNLYYQAVDNGDLNSAQNINAQLDSLSVKIQNEQDSAQRAAGSMAMNGVKTLDALVKKITKGEELVELPDGTVIKPLGQLNNEVKGAGETEGDYFGEALRSIQALQQIVADAYAGATTQEAVDAIESKYGNIISGEKTFKTAAGDLSMSEIELAYRSSLANNPLYSPEASMDETTGQLTYKLTKNKVDDFVWARNDDGTYQAVETRAKVTSGFQKLSAKVTDEGYFLGDTGKEGVSQIGELDDKGKPRQVKTKGVLTIGERLNNLGIQAEQNEDGSLTLTTQEGTFQGAIMPNGSIRFFGDPGEYSGGQAGLYEIDIFSGNRREVAPDEESIFGTRSIFGGQLSKASDAGIEIIKNLAGVYKPKDELFSPLSQITSSANDFSGRARNIVGGNLQGSTNILQGAEDRRIELETKRLELQAQQQAQFKLQQAQAFNLNQTPVQQFAQNGAPIKQLTVAPPAPTRRLTVAAPQPAPRISSVSVAQPTQRITSVGVANPQPRLTVR